MPRPHVRIDRRRVADRDAREIIARLTTAVAEVMSTSDKTLEPRHVKVEVSRVDVLDINPPAITITVRSGDHPEKRANQQERSDRIAAAIMPAVPEQLRTDKQVIVILELLPRTISVVKSSVEPAPA